MHELNELKRISKILELAQIIKDEEAGLDDNAAYARAVAEIDEVAALASSADQPLNYRVPMALAIQPTTHGLLLTQGRNSVVISPARLDQVLEAGKRWKGQRRRGGRTFKQRQYLVR